MMNTDGIIKTVNMMTPWAGFIVLGAYTRVDPEKREHFKSLLFGTQQNNTFLNITVKF